MPFQYLSCRAHRYEGELTRTPKPVWPAESAEQAHPLLTELAGPDDAGQIYAVHVGFVRHGRRICRARRPACAECPLAPMCPSAGLV